MSSRHLYATSTAQAEAARVRGLLRWLGGAAEGGRTQPEAKGLVAQALEALNKGASRKALIQAAKTDLAALREDAEQDALEAELGRGRKVRSAGGYSGRAAEAIDAGIERSEPEPLPSEYQIAWAPIPVRQGAGLTTAREERAIAKRWAQDVAAGVARVADGADAPPLPNPSPVGEEALEAGEAPSFPEDVAEQLGAFALAAKLKGTKAPSRDSEAEDAHASASAAQAVTREQARALLAGIEQAQAEARAHWLGKLYAAGVQAKALGYTQAQAAIKAAYIAVRDRQPLGNLIPDARAAFKKEAQNAALR